MKKEFILIVLLLVSSCATGYTPEFEESKTKDLVETFSIETKKYNHFATKKIQVKKRIKKKLKIAKVVPAQILVKKDKSSTQYADDYPEIFKSYNKKYKKYWSQSVPKIMHGERFTFKLSYLGLTAGFVKLTTGENVSIAGKEAYHFHAQLKSADYYSYIYSLNDSLDSYVSKDNFIPLKFSLIQRESGQNVDDLQIFKQSEYKTHYWYYRLKKGKEKRIENEKYIPKYFQDSFSAIHFVRSFPLKVGDEYEFPVVTRAKVWLIKIKVEKKEEIYILGKKILAIKLNAETRFPGVLKKKGAINFWYSADSTKKLLKFSAKIKLGSVKGELIDYKGGSAQ